MEIPNAIAAVRAALEEVEMRMQDLVVEYRRMMAPCRLVLYLKRSREGRPLAIYWGRAFRRQLPDGSTRRLRAHLPGRLKTVTIYRTAFRLAERAVFFDFDRRRLALNGEHARLARALGRVKRSIAFRAKDGLAVIEREMRKLVHEHRSLGPLFPYVTSGRNGNLAVGWAIPWSVVREGRPASGRRHVASRLRREILLRLKIPRASWPALRAIDRRMHELRKEHARYAQAVGKVRRILKAVA